MCLYTLDATRLARCREEEHSSAESQRLGALRGRWQSRRPSRVPLLPYHLCAASRCCTPVTRCPCSHICLAKPDDGRINVCVIFMNALARAVACHTLVSSSGRLSNEGVSSSSLICVYTADDDDNNYANPHAQGIRRPTSLFQPPCTQQPDDRHKTRRPRAHMGTTMPSHPRSCERACGEGRSSSTSAAMRTESLDW